MRKIKDLLKTAKQMLAAAISDTFSFSFNDDQFIEALGLNPKDYEVVLADGTVMYDADRALNDTAKVDWQDGDLP